MLNFIENLLQSLTANGTIAQRVVKMTVTIATLKVHENTPQNYTRSSATPEKKRCSDNNKRLAV